MTKAEFEKWFEEVFLPECRASREESRRHARDYAMRHAYRGPFDDKPDAPFSSHSDNMNYAGEETGINAGTERDNS